MTRITKARQAEIDASAEELRDIFSQCAAYIHHATDQNQPKVYVKIASVSRSGMTRRMEFWVIDPRWNGLRRITSLIADVTGWPINSAGLRVDGAGMDMTFHTMDVVARSLKMPGITSGNDFHISIL